MRCPYGLMDFARGSVQRCKARLALAAEDFPARLWRGRGPGAGGHEAAKSRIWVSCWESLSSVYADGTVYGPC
jgi:hypothetical protein